MIASDGQALELLRREFPKLESRELPSYGIRYSHHPRWMPLKMLAQVPKVIAAVRKENKMVQTLVEEEGIEGIISDNRFGVISRKVPSVYLTHQLSVLWGLASPLTSGIHARIIRRFDQCWACDFEGEASLAGALSLNEKIDNVRYIGPLSRFQSGENHEKEIDICFVISGPEPQRELFQRQVEKTFANHSGKNVLVEGIVKGNVENRAVGNMSIYNYLLSDELASLMQNSSLVVARSGYSTVMDLNNLGAKAFFVPTPGQREQEYLACYLKGKGVAGFSDQARLNSSSLERAPEYEGFIQTKTSNNNQFDGLFDVFK